MANADKNIDVDQAAIERYLQGRMSAAEMHRFELAMLDDPFLADAVEGLKYSNQQLSANHLQALENEISKTASEEKKAAVILLHRNYWWRVAAGIMVIAGAGVITYKALQPVPTDNNLAQGTVPTTKQEDTATAILAPPVQNQTGIADIVPEKQTSIPKVSVPEKAAKQNPVVAENDNKLIAAVESPKVDAANNDDAKESKAEDIANRSAEKDATRGRSVENISNNNVYQQNATNKPMVASGPTEPDTRNYRGRVTRSNGEPVVAAIVKSNNNSTAITDEEGNFDIKAKGDTASITVEGIGIAKANAVLKSNSANNIVVKDADLTLSEVVVVGYGNSKKQEATTATKSVRGKIATSVGGMDAFNQYATNAFKAAIDSSKYATAEVQLNFIIGRNGKPSNIVVVKSTDSALDKAAIKVLENGPKWNGNISQQASVVIKCN